MSSHPWQNTQKKQHAPIHVACIKLKFHVNLLLLLEIQAPHDKSWYYLIKSYVIWDAPHATASVQQASICCTPPWWLWQQGIKLLLRSLHPSTWQKGTCGQKVTPLGRHCRATTCICPLRTTFGFTFHQELKLLEWIRRWTPLHGSGSELLLVLLWPWWYTIHSSGSLTSHISLAI
jgi:hypothetical protein